MKRQRRQSIAQRNAAALRASRQALEAPSPQVAVAWAICAFANGGSHACVCSRRKRGRPDCCQTPMLTGAADRILRIAREGLGLPPGDEGDTL